jgi:lambda family phage portal protein
MSALDSVKSFFRKALFPNYDVIQSYDDSEMQTFELSGGNYWGGQAYGNSYYTGGGDGSKWPYGLSNSGRSPILNHQLLRQNARSAYHDTLAAKSVVDRYADTVINVGLKLEATPNADTLGLTVEQIEKWASQVEQAFDLWASSKKSTLNESMTFYQTQRVVSIAQQRDGEYFCRLHYSNRRDLLNPLQISFFDPNQVRGDSLTSTYMPLQWFNGIKKDKNGKEIAYNIWIWEGDRYKQVELPAFSKKSKRKFVLHGYQPEYFFQDRGYSRLSHALQEFENLTDFTSAQIKKAIIQSTINMYVKPSKDNAASAPFDGITNDRPAGPADLFGGSVEQAGVTTPLEDLVRYTSLPEATFDSPGSVGVFNLKEGEDLKPFDGTAPAESYEQFTSAFISHLSASFSIPIEVLLMKFGQNYSASRGALILFWQVAQIWQKEIASDFLDPIYEMWLSGEIASGRISAPGWSDPRLRAAWLSNNWIGVPMPNIDPMKTAKADQVYAEMGAHTLDRVARSLNGSDGKRNRAKLAREFEELPESPFKRKQGDKV